MADADKHITYSLADIQRYLQGGMNAREMHNLERAALEDPFLADALEGYREADMQQAQTHLTQIDTAIRQQNKKGKIVALPPARGYFNWQIAAAVILLVGIAGATYFIFNKETPATVAFAPVKKNSDSKKMQDSSTAHLQTILPPSADTTTIAKVEKKQNRQVSSAKAKRKKNKAAELDSSAWQAPENATALAMGADKAAQSSNPLSDEVVMTTERHRIAGIVTDNHRQPVPNAKVELQDSTAAVTDKNGKFYIFSTDTAAMVNITAFGYKPVNNQKLRLGKNNIVLKERPFLLSDVEVINIGTAGKKLTDTTATMPEGGWQSFREYVYDKLQKKYDTTSTTNAYIDGDLQLEFSINDFGEPTDFKVLHAPDEQTAKEAISAIQTGPKWVNGDKKNKLRITVRYK